MFALLGSSAVGWPLCSISCVAALLRTPCAGCAWAAAGSSSVRTVTSSSRSSSNSNSSSNNSSGSKNSRRRRGGGSSNSNNSGGVHAQQQQLTKSQRHQTQQSDTETAWAEGLAARLRLAPTNLADPVLPSVTADASSRPLLAPTREALALLRRFNVVQPELCGQVVLAKVLRTSRSALLVDPGYHGLCTVPLSQLASTGAYDAAGRPLPRGSGDGGSPGPGDFIRVRLSLFDTPYGDPQLDEVGVAPDVRARLVWEELTARWRSGREVLGRVLNATARGYAVGVGGYVALLQHDRALPEVSACIGALQPFYIAHMDAARSIIQLSGVRRDMEDMYRRSL